MRHNKAFEKRLKLFLTFNNRKTLLRTIGLYTTCTSTSNDCIAVHFFPSVNTGEYILQHVDLLFNFFDNRYKKFC